MSLKSPLGRVLGHGAAGGGAGHWWTERATALALVPLGLWFLASLVRLPLADHAAMRAWLGHIWSALFVLLFVVTLAWHSRLGVQVVIEDYVHGKGRKMALMLLSSALHLVAAGAAVLAVLRIALGAGA